MLAVLAGGPASLSAAPVAEPHQQFDLPAGDAVEILQSFARLTHVQLIYPARALRGLRTRALHGDYTVSAALTELLAGSPFEVIFDPPTDSYGVRRRAAPAAPVALPELERARVGREEPLPLSPVAVERRREHGVATQSILPADQVAPLYYHVVTREEIEQSGASNIAEFLTTVPGYSGEGAESLQATADLKFASGANVNVGSFLKLRGWDSRHTAVLLNGRRLPPSPESTGPDLSRIPLAAVERIEVLPFAGSALYGDGAVGGAMNILLRKDVVGPSLSLQFGASTHGGGAEQQATWIQGWNSASGRTQVTAIGSFEHHDILRLGDRDFLARAETRLPPSSLLGSNNFGPNLRPLLQAIIVGYPGVFTATTAATNLGLPNAPTAQFAVVPAGQNASQLQPSSFTTIDPTKLQELRQSRIVLRPPADIVSASVEIAHAIVPDRLEWYGELDYSRYYSRFSAPDAVEPLALELTDPRNPFRRLVTPDFFGRSASYYFDPLDLPDARLRQTRDGLRAVFGIRGTPPARWHWSVDNFFDVSRSRSSVDSYGASLNDLLRNWTSANGNTLAAIYDPLADHRSSPVSLAGRDRYLRRHSWLDYRSLMFGSELRAGGNLVDLPAGPVRLELGAEFEWRDHSTRQGADASRELYATIDALSNYANITQTQQSIDRGNRIGALAEAIVPLFRRGKTKLPIHAAELDFASRVARTDRGEPAASSLVALKMAPTRSWALRATYSQGDVTPSSVMVNGPVVQTAAVVSVIDPLRGNVQQFYPVQLIQGGSGSLAPETSHARVLGFLLTPQSLPRFFLSIDAWSIRMSDRLRSPTVQELVSYAQYFPDSVTRNAPLGWEQALGWSGPITRVDLRPVHITRLEADGMDVAFRYRTAPTRFGTFTLSGQLETVRRYAEQFLPVTSLIDKVNVVAEGTSTGLMESAVASPRGRATLGWHQDGWFASVTANYVPRYHTDTTTPTAALPTATGIDGEFIPSSTLWDLQAGYSFGPAARWIPDTTWTIGVRNLFDREPPLRTDGSSFYSRFDDPRLRFIYVRLQWRR